MAATKKSPAKSSGANAPAKKSPAKKTAPEADAPKPATKSKSAPKAESKSAAAKPESKPLSKPQGDTNPKKAAAKKTYSDPALREKLKEEIKAGDKGGKPGQWSARKAQLLAHEYEAKGGTYTGPKTDTQKHLSEWTEEKWTTADGKPADKGDEMARYLPEKAWGNMTDAEKKKTDAKKRAGSKEGKQFVPNTPAAKAAKKKAQAKG